MNTRKIIPSITIKAPETIEEAIKMLDDAIELTGQSLKELKSQRAALKKLKAKRDKLPHQEHSDCSDLENSYNAALATISQNTAATSASIAFAQGVYNEWQDCLNS